MPFWKTAYLPGKGIGGSLLHFNLARLRVIGFGSLQLALKSLQDVDTDNLASLQLPEQTSREMQSLANFIEPCCALYGKTETINEYMKISKIVVGSKFYASEDPM